MNELIQNLVKESLIKKCPNQDLEIAKQKSSYQQLLKRAQTPDLRVQYLANYDALLRLVEIYLLNFGYLLGNHPHSAARRILNCLTAELNILNLITLRHEVKKSNHQPTLVDIQNLSLLREKIEKICL